MWESLLKHRGKSRFSMLAGSEYSASPVHRGIKFVRKLIVLVVSGMCAAPMLAGAAQLLVLNKSDATLSFVDPQTGKASASIQTGEGPHEIELSSDRKLAFVTNYGASQPGNSLSVIDVQARKELKRVDLGELRRPHGLAFAGGKAYFTAENAKRIGRYDPKTQRVDWTIDTDQDRTHMVIATRDGTKLFASNMG